jgi:hypothetical protein
MGEHSWARLIAGASPSPVPPPVSPQRGCPHAPIPLPHLGASAALHRQAHAHEPRQPAPDAVAEGFRGAVGTAEPPHPSPREGRGPADSGHSLVILRRHGSDGLALHQPEWNAAVEPIAKRMHMSYVGKRFIGAEFTDVQCLTTKTFRFSSMRTWVSNSRFNFGRTRSIRVVRSWLPMLPVATIKSLAGVPCKR